MIVARDFLQLAQVFILTYFILSFYTVCFVYGAVMHNHYRTIPFSFKNLRVFFKFSLKLSGLVIGLVL